MLIVNCQFAIVNCQWVVSSIPSLVGLRFFFRGTIPPSYDMPHFQCLLNCRLKNAYICLLARKYAYPTNSVILCASLCETLWLKTIRASRNHHWQSTINNWQLNTPEFNTCLQYNTQSWVPLRSLRPPLRSLRLKNDPIFTKPKLIKVTTPPLGHPSNGEEFAKLRLQVLHTYIWWIESMPTLPTLWYSVHHSVKLCG